MMNKEVGSEKFFCRCCVNLTGKCFLSMPRVMRNLADMGVPLAKCVGEWGPSIVIDPAHHERRFLRKSGAVSGH